MNTKLLLLAASALFGIFAIACLFAPAEILTALGSNAPAASIVVVQLLGAAYLGFSMLDWASHGSIVGGIYGRPLTLANLAYFASAAIGLGKLARGPLALPLGALGLIHALFALAFTLLMNRPAVPPRPDAS